MPRLIIFVPCENVIVGQGNNAASLIVIIHELHITLPATTPDPIPPNSATQIRWFIFSQWEIAPEDVGTRFEQKVEMVDAAGNIRSLSTTSDFVPEANKPLHRMIAALTFFPLVPAGNYRLNTSIRRAGTDGWTSAGSYPLQVSYERVGVAQEVVQ